MNPASHQVTCLASATLAKCGFLCTVLAENPEYHNLAFRVGLFGLEMARPPANTKPLEVKFNVIANRILLDVISIKLMVIFTQLGQACSSRKRVSRITEENSFGADRISYDKAKS